MPAESSSKYRTLVWCLDITKVTHHTASLMQPAYIEALQFKCQYTSVQSNSVKYALITLTFSEVISRLKEMGFQPYQSRPLEMEGDVSDVLENRLSGNLLWATFGSSGLVPSI